MSKRDLAREMQTFKPMFVRLGIFGKGRVLGSTDFKSIFIEGIKDKKLMGGIV